MFFKRIEFFSNFWDIWDWSVTKIIKIIKIFLLRQLKPIFKQEQRSVTKFLLAEKYKPFEIYKTMYAVYGEVYFSLKMV